MILLRKIVSNTFSSITAMSESSASAQLAKVGVVTAKNGPQDDDFDMFAQSRTSAKGSVFSQSGVIHVDSEFFFTEEVHTRTI